MGRKNFFLKSLLLLAGQFVTIFAVIVAVNVSLLAAICSSVLVLAVTYHSVRLICQRLKDIAPGMDLGLLYGAFFMLWLLSAGIVYLALFFVPSGFIPKKVGA